MKSLKSVLLCLILLMACENEPVGSAIDETIEVDSELYNLIQRVTESNVPEDSITCIEFIYPISLFVLDENDDILSSQFIANNQEFSTFLESLESSNSISISYPISTVLNDGNSFIINNNDELKESIDSCVDRERIGNCEELLRNCVWKVGYIDGSENDYLGGYFSETDPQVTFNYGDETYQGSWTVLLIEDELFININLVDETTEITAYFNHNWKVTYIDENSLRLSNENRDMVLNQRCDQDFDLCTSFYFEACENEVGSEVSDFILNDYSLCILDTLELDDGLIVSFYKTQEDAENNTNPIAGNEVYNNTENNERLFVKIIDEDNSSDYIVEIVLISITC